MLEQLWLEHFLFFLDPGFWERGGGSKETNTHNPKIPEFKWESSSCCEYKTALPFSKINLTGKKAALVLILEN